MLMKNSLFSEIIYGGDYNPEQWLGSPEILEKDIELMLEASINTVTLGVFAWAALEPREGEFHLEWLRKIIDRLGKSNIRTILATPSGARPRWMATAYPEVLRVREDGVRMRYGERHNHCPTSPVYREKVALINEQLASAFGNDPHVILWHISNEYGGECHCELCEQAFRRWLEARYGDIGAVNRAWWTPFWSHQYSSFSEVESPSAAGDSGLLGLNLDWKRFVTAQTLDFLCAEREALRRGGALQPTTTNFMEDYTGLNYYQLAQGVDIVSWDSYPRWHCGNDVTTALQTGYEHDLMRGLRDAPWLLMESSPSGVNWHGVSRLKKPGLLMNAGLQAIAHGSASVQYFQIRQSRGGFEKFHGAVIDQYGENDTRVFQEAAASGAVFAELSRLPDFMESRVESCAAVLYDTESRWALEGAQGPRNEGVHCLQTLHKVYGALRRCGLNVDVLSAQSIGSAEDLTAYRVVAAPMLYMFREGMEASIRGFVEGGGTLLMTYLTGVADETDLCYLGGTPHGIRDVLGLRTEEIDALPDGERNRFLKTEQAPEELACEYSCSTLCEIVRLEGAVPLMAYGEDFYKGSPALTRSTYGSGTTYFVAADAEQRFYDDLLRYVARDAGLHPLLAGLPAELLVSARCSPRYEYVFVQNFSGRTIQLPAAGDAVVVYGDTVLSGFRTAVLQRKK